MAWYKDWFGAEYLALYKHRSDAEARELVNFLISEGIFASKPKVLDIACGAARHLSALLTRGLDAYGVDLSPSLLSQAESRLQATSSRGTRLCRADMRSLPFADRSFEVLCSFFTSFGYFDSDAAHSALLREWNRTTKPGGTLVLDYLNKPFVLETLVEESRRETDEYEVWERRALTEGESRVNKSIEIKSKINGQISSFQESVRLYDLEELRVLLRHENFNETHLYGDYAGASHGASSPRLLLISTTPKD